MRSYRYVVTYEFVVAKPETIRGAVQAGSIAVAALRAAKRAREAFPRRKPCSVVVLIELPNELSEGAQEAVPGGHLEDVGADTVVVAEGASEAVVGEGHREGGRPGACEAADAPSSISMPASK